MYACLISTSNRFWDDEYILNLVSPVPLHSKTLTKPIRECVSMFSWWWRICFHIYASHPV